LIFTKSYAETIVSIGAKKSGKNEIRWEGVGVYRKKEELSDYTSAIKAIDAGRRSAVATHNLIYGLPAPLFPDNVIMPNTNVQNVTHIENAMPSNRNLMPLSDPKELAKGYERKKGFDNQALRDEAKRCLQCGLICYEKDGN